ncbi:hypothetical protein F5Y15DRAFT_30738 [Xylariaceae sp. FL0016]|nr:hypothetical protein F5Y15DRAFT_30738 [Xylariaceae sp. FL0016]
MAVVEAQATSSADPTTPYTRLHITPLDQSLLTVVIPSSVLPRARNVSYHTLETFPEKRYGYVEIPTADADKLKKKLNGAVLRGAKMRVEKARPEAIPESGGDEDVAPEKKERKKKDKSKKRKREHGVVDGVELEDRKVKRGWTTSEKEMIDEKRKKAKKEKKPKDDKKDRKEKKDKKKGIRTKSKYTDAPECLFRTKLPNSNPPKEDGDDSEHQKKKKRRSDREVVVHEFEKTMKVPSFLKVTTDNSKSAGVTFQDGVGWVDSTGTVIEAVKTTRPAAPAPSKASKVTQAKKADLVLEEDSDETSSSGSSSSDDSDGDSADEASEQEVGRLDEQIDIPAPPKKLKVETKIDASVVPSPASAARPKSSGSATSLTIKIPPVTPAKVHPLEALYKRSKEDAEATAQQSQPFSFFGNGEDDDIEEEEENPGRGRSSQPPMTPFTKQDYEFRNIRSAAPTPDTAHPTRSFNLWSRSGSAGDVLEEEDEDQEDESQVQQQHEMEQEDEDVEMAEPTTPSGKGRDAPTSDFQKQFWEKRGDLNRTWRKRRKTTSKEKRYRENRARAARAI